MKQFIKSYGGIVGMLVIAIIMAFMASCSDAKKKLGISNVDSTYVSNAIHEVLPTDWTDAQEFEQYVSEKAEKAKSDSVIKQLYTNGILHNVVTVVAQKHKNLPFTEQDVVDEYIRNKDVYINLPKDSKEETPPNIKDTITQIKYFSTTKSKDTVMNGKHTIIITEE